MLDLSAARPSAIHCRAYFIWRARLLGIKSQRTHPTTRARRPRLGRSAAGADPSAAAARSGVGARDEFGARVVGAGVRMSFMTGDIQGSRASNFFYEKRPQKGKDSSQ